MDGQRARRICMAISTIFFLQGRLLSTVLRGSTLVDVDDAPDRGNGNTNILKETVELLFMGNTSAAHEYLAENPLLESFKFYTHDLPPLVETVDSISECLQDWGFGSERFAYATKERFLENICDWSESICNPSNHTRASQYSTARLNNNIDAVMARLFTNYHGRFRTFNATEALLKVVPFPAVSNGRCNSHYRRGRHDPSTSIILSTNRTRLHDHLFLFVNDHAALSVDKLPTKRFGQLVVPYVNTNAEYQPDKLISSLNAVELDRFFSGKKYALSAVFSQKISGNGYARKEFVERADTFFGNGTIAHNNGTLGDMPVRVVVIQEKRKMVGEAHAMHLYRKSIFCPCFRGDTPNQKRIFDAMLSGCIPVVMAHYYKANADDEANSTSYFAPGRGVTTTKTYPWARGSFGDRWVGMGLDYSKLVVEIEEITCGHPPHSHLDCLPATLKRLLGDPVALRMRQRNLAKYARLFSFGLQQNAFQYADAMSALLVQARQYALDAQAMDVKE